MNWIYNYSNRMVLVLFVIIMSIYYWNIYFLIFAKNFSLNSIIIGDYLKTILYSLINSLNNWIYIIGYFLILYNIRANCDIIIYYYKILMNSKEFSKKSIISILFI